MKLKQKGKVSLLILFIIFTIVIISGCSADEVTEANEKEDEGKKVFNYGTMAYGVAMHNPGLNPHDGYTGWSTVRYGVGETLFKFNEAMELEPWLATDYEYLDDYTVKINLRDDVLFANGDKMTGELVKDSLENLIEVHDRAPADLKIKSITSEGQSITITSESKVPTILNYLSDPYGSIIHMGEGVSEDDNVVGTGPYQAVEVTDTNLKLVPNEEYWGGSPKMDEVNIISITDGDTLTMALQSGEIDAAQGLPYASLELFDKNDEYKINSTNTSRLYQAALNFESEVIQDDAVREAMAMSIDKEGFTSVLLHGNGAPAIGPFPDNFKFGGDSVQDTEFDIEGAKDLLESAGWKEVNKDGIREKNGQKLSIDWLTYTSRQELPLLAESVQATFKEVGIEVNVNATDNYQDFLDAGEYDVFANAFVAAPTGDPQYYFTTHVVDNSDYNSGHYHNEEVEKLEQEMRNEFDPEQRGKLAVDIAQHILDDHAYIYASHLKMSFVMKSDVQGFEAHPSDYYEVTVDLDRE